MRETVASASGVTPQSFIGISGSGLRQHAGTDARAVEACEIQDVKFKNARVRSLARSLARFYLLLYLLFASTLGSFVQSVLGVRVCVWECASDFIMDLRSVCMCVRRFLCVCVREHVPV